MGGLGPDTVRSSGLLLLLKQVDKPKLIQLFGELFSDLVRENL